MMPELLDRSPKAAPYLKFDIWRIEVQQTPEALLQYIGSTEGWQARAWATERAAQKGIQKEKIREAILGHVSERKAQGTDRKGESCAEIKRAGLSLGILLDSDLPDVEIPKLRETP